MRVLGMLSGTSHDGIDLAVVDFDRVGEDGLRGSLVWTGEVPYSAATRRLLVEALPPARTTMEAVCRLDVSVGREFASAAAGAIAAAGPVEVICSHGQTVYHGVEDGAVWGTLQIGQPAWIAEETGIPVIADVRTRDVAAGGQGAPLVPLLDGMLAAREKTPVAFLNLGGIANATIVDAAGASVAYDIGPANALIDAAMSAHPTSPAPYDADGAAAARGTIDPALLDLLMDDPFYRLAPPKSTGKELFNAAYVAERAGGVAGDDLVATLTELTARVVARDLRAHGVARVVVSGGGIRNPVLSARLRALLDPATVETSDALGIPADSKEAIAFALIGWFTVNGLPANVPAATGARGGRVLGSIVPGAGPLPPADGGRRPSWISFGEPA